MRLKKIFQFILVIAIITGFVRTVRAGELISPRVGASYVKLTDGTKRISVSLSASVDDKRVNIMNVSVQISAGGESGKALLGTVVTDQKG